MSDLEDSGIDQRVRQWREKMVAAIGQQRETFDELEGHLRDAFTELTEAGHSPDEAWQLAIDRLGSVEQLAAEFRKLPAKRPGWLLSARLVLGLHVLIVGSIAWVALRGFIDPKGAQDKYDPLLAFHTLSVLIGYTALLAIGVVTFWTMLVRAVRGWDSLDTQRLSWSIRAWSAAGVAATGLGILLGCFWSREHLGRFWGWDIKETAALVVFLWTSCVLVWTSIAERPGGLVTMLLGQASSFLVLLCWFGPVYLPQGLHSYGFPPVGMAATSFSLGLFIVLIMSLCPPGGVGRLLSTNR